MKANFILIPICLFMLSCNNKDMSIERKNLDFSTDPGTDFYQFANGGWMLNNPMPPEFSRYGSFDVLAEQSVTMVKGIVEEASGENPVQGSIRQKVGDFYKTGMDSVTIDKLGISPLKPELDIINSAKDVNHIQDFIARWHSLGSGLLFTYYGAPDRVNSEMVLANLNQGGLGMTDVEYYTGDDENAIRIREEYKKYISRMFELAGDDETLSSSRVEVVMKMETRLAKASMTRLERRDPHLTFNKMPVHSLQTLTPGINWGEFFEKTGSPAFNEINVGQPQFFKEVNAMFAEYSIEDWKTYLTWHVLNRTAEYLSSEFINAHFNFYGKFLSGKLENQARWKRVLRFSDSALGEAIGEMYVEKYFPSEAKERMLSLVSNLRSALGERIMSLDWMSETTKEEAMAKLNKINVKIGYPEKWRDYSGLEISETSFFTNVLNASKFNFNFNINKIGKPVDPNEWGMTPQTVNAYYSPSLNEIVFPAGILQPPFFYMDADDAVNYGAIGMVIGHEMTHGFDDKGRQYDKNGNLNDWWTNEDAERFTERSQVLVDQYDQFEVLDGVMANGKLSLGENIADLGGLNISLLALKKINGNNSSPKKINGFTPEQRFFLAYAHVWAQNITDTEILRRTKEDVHSLGKYRVNGPLPHMPEFYEAFGITENSPMYIKPEKRAVIW